jgi:hypothetical protein
VNARLKARLAHRARSVSDDDLRRASAWRDAACGMLLIGIGLFGSAIADWWIPPDTDAGIDPAGETELAWISDAPSPWITERVDLPPAPPLIEPEPRVCEQFGTCRPETGVEQQ